VSFKNDADAKAALGPVIANFELLVVVGGGVRGHPKGVLEYVAWDDSVPILFHWQQCSAVPKCSVAHCSDRRQLHESNVFGLGRLLHIKGRVGLDEEYKETPGSGR
jgi:hypothetical protein